MYQVSKGLASVNMCIHPILYMALVDSIRVACCGKRLEDNNSVEMGEPAFKTQAKFDVVS